MPGVPYRGCLQPFAPNSLPPSSMPASADLLLTWGFGFDVRFFSLPKGPSFVSLSAEVGRSLRQEGLIVDF